MIDYENLKKLNLPFEQQFQEKFNHFIDKGWYILGEQVRMFEQEFANYCGAKHCIGLASGLDALFLALKIYDFPKGSEVIVPSNTYIATILSIINAGLKPVLVEPNLDTYNINAALIEGVITSKTKAIMVVHLYGKSCEMDKIMDIANQYDLKVVEDCAQSHGATFKNKMTGTFGDWGAFSFYPTKNLGALGDAGALITNNDALAEKMRALRNYGSEQKYHNKYIGWNSRLDELQASFLRIKLEKLNDINEHKRKLATIYQEKLNTHIIKPIIQKDYFDVFHIYNIRHTKRDALKEYLLKSGVKTEIHYPVAPTKQAGYKKYFRTIITPIAEEIHQTTLSLPISFCHTENEIVDVIKLINSF